jgi:hypothetical protein
MTWPLPDPNLAPGPLPTTAFEPINRDSTGGGPYAPLGARFARPASTHPSMFIAAFCEGNAREIRQDIDFRVYQQLMTPDGMKAAYANSPKVYFENNLNKRFMNPPLSPSDY